MWSNEFSCLFNESDVSSLSTCDDMKYIRLFVAWFMQCTLLMYSHIVLYSLFLKLQLRFVVAAFT